MLQERLRDSVHGTFALQLMEGPHGHPEGEEAEQLQELRNILAPLLAKRIEILETEALKAYAANPSDSAIKAHYQALVERRKLLRDRVTSRPE